MNEKAMPKYEKAKAANDAALALALTAEQSAANAAFKDNALNEETISKIAEWRAAHKAAGDAKKKIENKPYNYIPGLIGLPRRS